MEKGEHETERRVVLTSDVAFCAGYRHYRLVHPVDEDEAVDIYTLEGITVLVCGVTIDFE